VLNVGHGVSVQGLVASVANGRQVHPRSLFFDFNSLELGVMELTSILLILNLSRVSLVLEVTELSLAEFILGGCLVLVVSWGHKTAGVLTVDGDAGLLGEGLSV